MASFNLLRRRMKTVWCHHRILALVLLSFLAVCALEATLWVADYLVGDADGQIAALGLSRILYVVRYILLGLVVVIFICSIWPLLVKRLLLSMITLSFFIGVVEGTSRLILKRRSGPASTTKLIEQEGRSIWASDARLNYKHASNTVIDARMTHGTDTVYEVTYTTDAHGGRKTTRFENRNQHALFVGCSFTFGIGVNDDETMPVNFAQEQETYNAYNYGTICYGPNMVLAQFENGTFPDAISEQTGVVVYTYIDSHVQRALGCKNSCQWDGGIGAPYYAIEDGQPLFMGSFASGRPVTTRRYQWMGKVATLNVLKIDEPYRIGKRHYQFVAALLHEADRLYREQFDGLEFIVLIYPGQSPEIKPYLEAVGLSVLDYSNMYQRSNKDHFLNIDRHPSPSGHKTVAQRLAADLANLASKRQGESLDEN
jgi:hypothetical protein